MFDIGFWELLLIAVVALVVVGPERLPKLIRVTGLWIGRANASIRTIRSEISQELRAEELKQALKKPIDDMPDLKEVIPLDSVKTTIKDSNGNQ
ncbi:MAG: Sec-independent protein translocase protein TatB [Gammaproteobacteria bacterium]|nr:Sec-independent protein translocase protein TatB [Gammaproteobacteria bacterium]MDH5592395.1 Sec-independent protein translocase protein TatB [Gammaproteobacteria bacterium]